METHAGDHQHGKQELPVAKEAMSKECPLAKKGCGAALGNFLGPER